MTAHSTVIDQLLDHRSIRQYQDKAIPAEMLDTIIRAGQGAPTSSFVQAYSLIRVTDEEKRTAISEAAGGQAWVKQAPEFMVICADLQRVSYCAAKHGLEEQPEYTEHFMVACIDAALMAQNMFVAAESLGLGGVFIGGIRNDPARISEVLQLPERVAPVFGFCLGWPDYKPDVKPRMPVSSILHQNVYQQTALPQQVDDYDAMMQAYYQSRDSNQRDSNWSQQTLKAIFGKKREHMLSFLQDKGFLRR